MVAIFPLQSEQAPSFFFAAGCVDLRENSTKRRTKRSTTRKALAVHGVADTSTGSDNRPYCDDLGGVGRFIVVLEQ